MRQFELIALMMAMTQSSLFITIQSVQTVVTVDV